MRAGFQPPVHVLLCVIAALQLPRQEVSLFCLDILLGFIGPTFFCLFLLGDRLAFFFVTILPILNLAVTGAVHGLAVIASLPFAFFQLNAAVRASHHGLLNSCRRCLLNFLCIIGIDIGKYLAQALENQFTLLLPRDVWSRRLEGRDDFVTAGLERSQGRPDAGRERGPEADGLAELRPTLTDDAACRLQVMNQLDDRVHQLILRIRPTRVFNQKSCHQLEQPTVDGHGPLDLGLGREHPLQYDEVVRRIDGRRRRNCSQVDHHRHRSLIDTLF
mmetsp:Transcript_26770/g.60063  ORF Transcript_26770/g.60063 Transcript_26770/m.60063 type:complete len:274 (+) Transcript_26770:484-1305(+)